MVKIASCLAANLIHFSTASTRDDVIAELVDRLDRAGKLHDSTLFHDSILLREKLVSTGIGMGVALPHAKLPGYEDFFIAIGILSKGVDWGSLDHIPVRLVFLIGGPDNKQTEYLQLLSELTQQLKNEPLRKKMLTLNSVEDIINLFN
jgi:nitrogen PTS system EIIA component